MMPSGIGIVLIVLGLWVAFDGTVSAIYFASVDKTTHNTLDQTIRFIRIVVGIIVAILGAIIYA